jgi:class 3 adenylate cyclase
LPAEDAALLSRLFNEAEPVDAGLIAHAPIPAGRAGTGKPVSLFAVQFHEGIVFLYAPGKSPYADLPALLTQQEPAGGRGRKPALAEVAVLVTDLQHSGRLWAELPAEEYFELVNQIWFMVDTIFRRHRGVHGKHPGEGMVGYFIAQSGSAHLWDALSAAQQVREAMRGVSKEWQLRKGWATELHMNTGIDEGREWVGSLRPDSPASVTVLGNAADQALHISNYARSGSVWVTRNLVGKLRPDERQRLTYGVRRRDGEGGEVFVAASFRRVENLADLSVAGNEGLRAIARLPIAEVLDIAAHAAPAGAGGGRSSP